MSLKKNSLLSILIIVFLFSLSFSNNLLAAGKEDNVAEFNWSKSVSEVNQFTHTPYHLPDSKTVYLANNTDIFSETKVWSATVITAIDELSGTKKWDYTFYKKGTPYPWDTTLEFDKKGTIYALVKNGTGSQLFSVNSSGKSNWIISVPDASNLYTMNDGNILLVNSEKRNATGKLTPRVYAYNSKGIKVSERSIDGTYSVIGGQYFLSQVGELGNSKIDVYDTKLKKLFTYTLPKGAVTYVNELSWSINNGDILLRVNIPKTGNKLILINSKGKTLWGRNIPGNSSVQSIGQNYVVYTNGQLSMYNAKGFINKTIIEAEDPMTVIWETIDNNIQMFANNGKIIIDANTLEVLYEYPYDQNMLKYDYAGYGYLYAVKEGYQLFQYQLKR